jgi:Thiamine pyrophosphate enzyme, N-terminal TPP binding domain
VALWQRTLVFTGDPTRAIAHLPISDGKLVLAISTLLPVGSEEPNNGKEVANLVVDVLVEAGVERVYGVAGDSLNGSTDVIRTGGRLQWVHMRHDEAGAFAPAKRISRANWQFAPEVAGPEICI